MRKLVAVLLAVLIAVLPASAWAVALTSDAGEQLAGSDTVTFTVTATADAATATDASLRIKLSDDLTFTEGSVRIASPTNARVLDVISGSDGFVVLMDSLTAGDTIVFEAKLTGTMQSGVSCDAIQGTGESAQLSYVNAAYAPPMATDTATVSDAGGQPAEAAAAQKQTQPVSGTAIAVACGAGAVIIGAVVYFILTRKQLLNKNAGDGEPPDEPNDTEDTGGATQ